MESWLATPTGRLLLARERLQMRKVLPRFYGYRLLQIGAWEFDGDVLEASATLCQWVLGANVTTPSKNNSDTSAAAGTHSIDVFFNGESLPIKSRSVDAVILPHSLELGTTSHQLLREVDRILCDHGHLAILGFNPYSPWALRQLLTRGFKHEPRTRRYYSLGRVCDWLDLLDYELLSASRFGVGFPYLPAEGVDVANAGWWRIPGAAAQAYAVVARKRVIARTHQRGQAHRQTLPAKGMPEPTTRQPTTRQPTTRQCRNNRDAT